MPGTSPFTRRNVLKNPLARMLPIHGNQQMSYRLGETHPPSEGLGEYAPTWEVIEVGLAALGGAQARINLQRKFTLLAIAGQSTAAGFEGWFKAQFFDVNRQRRMSNRGSDLYLFGGSNRNFGTPASAPLGWFPLREPYVFDEPDSQILIDVRNLEETACVAQIMFYGVALRFNQIVGDTSQ